MVVNPILEVRPLEKWTRKKVLISQIRGHGEHREACPVIFSKISIFNRTLKMASHEGFAGGLKKKWGPASPAPNVDPNRPGPDLCGCHTASLWLPHRPRGAAREAREAREARAARAKV